MRVLLDTCVLSELYKSSPNQGVKTEVNNINDEDLYLSVITIGEIKKGISLLPDSRRQRDLTAWFYKIEVDYKDRILAIDSETGIIWGEITANLQKKGLIIGTADGLIAATALRHGLHLMTRNLKDFQETGILLINPWI